MMVCSSSTVVHTYPTHDMVLDNHWFSIRCTNPSSHPIDLKSEDWGPSRFFYFCLICSSLLFYFEHGGNTLSLVPKNDDVLDTDMCLSKSQLLKARFMFRSHIQNWRPISPTINRWLETNICQFLHFLHTISNSRKQIIWLKNALLLQAHERFELL